MARITAISLLSLAIVLVVVGILFPVVEGSTITTVYRICPLH
jgi:hypothetical protein